MLTQAVPVCISFVLGVLSLKPSFSVRIEKVYTVAGSITYHIHLLPLLSRQTRGQGFMLLPLHSHQHGNSGSHSLAGIFPHSKPFHPVPAMFLVNPSGLIFLKQHLACISLKCISVHHPPNTHICTHILLESFFRSNFSEVKIRSSGFPCGSTT